MFPESSDTNFVSQTYWDSLQPQSISSMITLPFRFPAVGTAPKVMTGKVMGSILPP